MNFFWQGRFWQRFKVSTWQSVCRSRKSYLPVRFSTNFFLNDHFVFDKNIFARVWSTKYKMPFTHSTFEPLSAQRGLSKSPKSHYLARWTYRQTLALSCRSRFHPPQSLDTTFNLPIFILSPVVLALSFYFELFRWIWTWVWEGKALSWANSKSWL